MKKSEKNTFSPTALPISPLLIIQHIYLYNGKLLIASFKYHNI
jgi:hypothetical protein